MTECKHMGGQFRGKGSLSEDVKEKRRVKKEGEGKKGGEGE